MFLSRENQAVHQRISYNARMISEETIWHSESNCASFEIGVSRISKIKYPLHDTVNHFHSNELCGISKSVPISHELCQDLRISQEVRLGLLSNSLNREKSVCFY